ncbi:MAG: fructose-bisphosphatase class II, partial [Alphaproteobacteria bacterium]
MSHGSKLSKLDRTLTLDAARVTEAAAIAAAKWRGRGDERQADQAAIAAMRAELNRLPINGRVVIGEDEDSEPPMLFMGENIGVGEGIPLDIAVDPVEGVTLCAKDNANALSVVVLAAPDSLLNVPGMYMDKLAIGPGYEPDVIDLNLSPAENL